MGPVLATLELFFASGTAPAVIEVMQPPAQRAFALLFGVIVLGVCPSVRQHAVEALDLSVGLRPVPSGSFWPDFRFTPVVANCLVRWAGWMSLITRWIVTSPTANTATVRRSTLAAVATPFLTPWIAT